MCRTGKGSIFVSLWLTLRSPLTPFEGLTSLQMGLKYDGHYLV